MDTENQRQQLAMIDRELLERLMVQEDNARRIIELRTAHNMLTQSLSQSPQAPQAEETQTTP